MHFKRFIISVVTCCLLTGGLFAQSITYVDVAGPMGISHPLSFIRGSVSLFDFDHDGLDDYSFTSIAGEPLYLYKNLGDTFVNVTESIGITDTARSMTILWVDYDNDGDRDLFIGHDGARNRLYRNNGKFQFTDVSDEAGIIGTVNTTNAACWGDYDNDGWIDLYATNYSEWEANTLYRNNGDGTFTDMTATAAVEDTIGGSQFFKTPLAVSFLDYDNDGWQDIYIANDHRSGNTLFHNNGDGTFNDRSEESGTDVSGFMMGLAIGDYDNNGYLDIYSTNDPLGNFFLVNNGDGTFTEMADSLGISIYRICWGTNFFDYDNDTDLDLFVAVAGGGGNAANALFANNGDGTFSEKFDTGMEADQLKSYGHSIGDFDNNGYYDIAVYNQQDPHNLYQASSGSNNWVKIELEGRESNRDGIGARIVVHLGEESFLRSTHCGISYMSQNSAIQTIGVGEATIIDSILIQWPGGAVDILRDVLPNQKINVIEGEPAVGIEEGPPVIAKQFQLEQNYPNPFNPSTIIRYSLFVNRLAVLEIYDISGKKIKAAINDQRSAGSYEFLWDGTNDNGQAVASGVYFYQLTISDQQPPLRHRESAVGGLSQVRKMMLIR